MASTLRASVFAKPSSIFRIAGAEDRLRSRGMITSRDGGVLLLGGPALDSKRVPSPNRSHVGCSLTVFSRPRTTEACSVDLEEERMSKSLAVIPSLVGIL